MNECHDCLTETELKQLLRQNLPAGRAAVAESHVQECRFCRNALDELTTWVNDDLRSQTTSENPSLLRMIADLSKQPPEALDTSNSGEIDDATAIARAGVIPGYTIRRMIARGGGGTLFEATEDRLHRTVAIKLLRENVELDEASQKRFQREAEALACTKHPHIVDVHFAGERKDGAPYLVMEYVEGTTLRDFIDDSKTPNIRKSADWVRSIATALSAIHERGLVHRDIKPSNILLDSSSGLARLTDFGLVLPEDRDTRLTVEGALAGTPDYMSPEQVRNPHLVDHRSDIYSLGAVLFESLAGQTPFRGVQRMKLLQVLHDEPSSTRHFNDQVPHDLDTICLKTLSKEPSRRYQTATEMANDISNWLEGRPIQARPVSSAERIWRWCRRNSRVAGLMALVVLLLSVLTGGAVLSAMRIGEAKRQADLQRDVVLETLQSMVFEFNDEFESGFADFDTVQESLLNSVLSGLSQIQRDADVQDTIDLTKLGALSRLAAIRYRANDDRGAITLCNRAIEFGRIASQDMKDDLRLIESLALAHWYLGNIQVKRKHFTEAIDELRQTLELETQLATRDNDFRQNLLSTQARLVELFTQTNELPAATAMLDAADETVEAMIKSDGDIVLYRRLEMMLRRAELLKLQGAHPKSQELARRAIAMIASDDELLDLDYEMGLANLVTVVYEIASTGQDGMPLLTERREMLEEYLELIGDDKYSVEEVKWVQQQLSLIDEQGPKQ